VAPESNIQGVEPPEVTDMTVQPDVKDAPVIPNFV